MIERICFLLDPPYFATKHYYDIEGGFAEQEHRDLAGILRVIKVNLY